MSDDDAYLRVSLRYATSDGEEVSTTVGAVDQSRLSQALPIRKFHSHSRQRHYSGLFWSSTTGGHIPYESRLELDRLRVADFDSTVAWISAQPMWLAGIDGDSMRRHVPDFLLTHHDGRLTVVDVKPREFALHPKAAEVFAWTRALCSARGWNYEVWHGGDPAVLANIKFTAVARRQYSPAWGVTPQLVEGQSRTTHDAVHEALYEIWSSKRAADLDVPLNRTRLAG